MIFDCEIYHKKAQQIARKIARIFENACDFSDTRNEPLFAYLDFSRVVEGGVVLVINVYR